MKTVFTMEYPEWCACADNLKCEVNHEPLEYHSVVLVLDENNAVIELVDPETFDIVEPPVEHFDEDHVINELKLY